MPIPAFDGILNVLPPHLGDPRQPDDLSPYRCTIDEVCARFATSAARKEILDGFLRFRRELHRLGIRGFQWLDGSFLEDIEAQENRDPQDMDVVTFVVEPAEPLALHSTLLPSSHLLSRQHVKETYHVDHFWIPLGTSPASLVEQTRYWIGLFSHRRDRVWKGMLVIDLSDPDADLAAWPATGGQP